MIDVQNAKPLCEAFASGDQLDVEFISEDGKIYRGKIIVTNINANINNYFDFKLIGSGVLYGA
nr:MAG: hypothetical protein DIU64_11885 [Caldicoprobacter oshimai]